MTDKGRDMAEPEDDDIGKYDGPEDAPETLYGTELWNEVRSVCDRAHELLGSEVIGGTGEAETERVCLDIPKGLLLIAQYLVAKEHFKQTGAWMDDAMADKGSEGKAVRKLVHLRLEKYLTDALHDELHWLATGGHRILQAEAERKSEKK
jgi:hypothetical protein